MDEATISEFLKAYPDPKETIKKYYDSKTGEVFIPPMAIKHVIVGAAKYTSLQIPGKGKKQYRKYCESGVMVTKPVMLGIHKDDVYPDEQYVPSDGQPGGKQASPQDVPEDRCRLDRNR